MAVPLAEHLDGIAATLRRAGRVLLCCDFDGTLVPIRDRPEWCTLALEARETLADLSRAEQIDVAVVSGRSLIDLRPRVGVDGIAYAGNHGLEIESPAGDFRHPVAVAARPALEVVIHRLRRELAAFPGVWVEDKGLSASVHFRLADQTQVPLVVARIDRVVSQSDAASDFVLRGGKSVREIRPSVNWNKGTAVQWLTARLSHGPAPTLTVYLGDDETDEDAFACVAHSGLSVCVGVRPATTAGYRIPDQTSVHQFLKWFATSIRDRRAIHAEPDGV